MSSPSAAARAEARRKAILSRGTDRLAKLTTSGRGDDPLYAQEAAPDPPLPSFPPTNNTSNFVGDETANMPRPRPRVPSRTPSNTSTNNANPANNPFGMPDPSAWSQDQQAQFLQALMGGGAPPPGGGGPGPSGNPFAGPGMENNPFAAMMAAAAGGAGGGFPQLGLGADGGAGAGPAGMEGNPFAAMMGPGMAGPGKAPDVAVPKTRLQRIMPALHLVAVWALLLYFVLVGEPAAHEAATGSAGDAVGRAWRWRQFGGAGSGAGWRAEKVGWVQLVPFFWAFVTLELVLHSLRIFTGLDAWRPPTLVALVLPHLPPPIPAVVVHSMKYVRMGSLVLDDVAAAVVGVGLVIWLAGWSGA
ncbi:hypothetical protein C8R43DRAFT_20746 [Mycena crocata]|nr:hypothetical protein C8R43DRAFT_20746 [Mycena crocata]